MMTELGMDLTRMRSGAPDEKTVVGDLKLSNSVSKKNTEKRIRNPEIDNAVKTPGIFGKKCKEMYAFTPEEDKILLEAISSNNENN